MPERYCLTVLEAAETANIDLEDLMAMIAANPAIAIRSDDNWRVDPDRLQQHRQNFALRQAA